MLGLGVSPGDEVIVADYTFPAPAHAVRYAGAVPVFADVRADTATVDPDAVAERLALASPKVQEQLGGVAPARVVSRPPKLVNLVTARPR